MSVVVSTKNSLSWAGSTAPVQIPDGIDFVFSSAGDANGVVYWIGSNEGQSAFTNPQTTSKIRMTRSSTYGGAGSVADLTNRQEENSHTNPGLNEWFAIDLGATRNLTISHYSMQCRAIYSDILTTDWTLQGCNSVGAGFTVSEINDAAWVNLQVVVGDSQMTGANTWTHKAVSVQERYRYFRIVNNVNNYFCVAEFEIYGKLRTVV